MEIDASEASHYAPGGCNVWLGDYAAPPSRIKPERLRRKQLQLFKHSLPPRSFARHGPRCRPATSILRLVDLPTEAGAPLRRDAAEPAVDGASLFPRRMSEGVPRKCAHAVAQNRMAVPTTKSVSSTRYRGESEENDSNSSVTPLGACPFPSRIGGHRLARCRCTAHRCLTTH
jgi:hypothetical protein